MSPETVVMLKEFIIFGDLLLSGKAKPFETQAFLSTLHDFNWQASNPDTFPFFFIAESDNKLFIDEDVINRMILDADRSGIASEFRKDFHDNGKVILFFSHAGRDFASQKCAEYDMSFANIGSNGLSFPFFSCTGLFSITAGDLRESVSVAKGIVS